MSVFLTPDQKPFWGGTYFPPDDRGGRPGFASILGALSETYAGRRQEVEAAADRLASALRQMEGGRQFVATALTAIPLGRGMSYEFDHRWSWYFWGPLLVFGTIWFAATIIGRRTQSRLRPQ